MHEAGIVDGLGQPIVVFGATTGVVDGLGVSLYYTQCMVEMENP
jgi:hypothetical protein